jgi:hypothetical protein
MPRHVLMQQILNATSDSKMQPFPTTPAHLHPRNAETGKDGVEIALFQEKISF